MTWHTNTTGGPHDRPQGPEVVKRDRTAADDLEDHIVRRTIQSYRRDTGEHFISVEFRDAAERAAQIAVEAMQTFFAEEKRKHDEALLDEREADDRRALP